MLYDACMSSSGALFLNTAIWCNYFLEVRVFLLIKVYLLLFSNVVDSLYCQNYIIGWTWCPPWCSALVLYQRT